MIFCQFNMYGNYVDKKPYFVYINLYCGKAYGEKTDWRNAAF